MVTVGSGACSAPGAGLGHGPCAFVGVAVGWRGAEGVDVEGGRLVHKRCFIHETMRQGLDSGQCDV